MATKKKGEIPPVKASVIQQVNPVGRPPEPRRITNIVLLLDESGSMGLLRDKLIAEANAQINKVAIAAADTGEDTRLSVATFAGGSAGGRPDKVRYCYRNSSARNLRPLSRGDYNPSGGTPMQFAINTIINDAEAFENLERFKGLAQVSHLIITLTDGQETEACLAPGVWARIQSLQKANFSFAFQGPRGSKDSLIKYGCLPDNILEWEQTAQGLERASVQTQASVGSYMASRSAGAVRSEAFYPDLSKVSASALKRELEDVTSKFKRFTVKSETLIKPFIESHGLPFNLGFGHYELMKPEKVQAHKSIVVMDKKTGKLYGGEEARELIGLAGGPGVEVRVKPGNHANYKIFISSTSTNRILPRGTEFLYKVK